MRKELQGQQRLLEEPLAICLKCRMSWTETAMVRAGLKVKGVPGVWERRYVQECPVCLRARK